jgi:putative transposase
MIKAFHQRKSIRLKDYDYSQPADYFVTASTHDQECILGDIVKDEMQLSPQGKIAVQCWMELPNHFTNVVLDEYVIMQNLVLGILILHDSGRDVKLNFPTKLSQRKGTLSVIVRTFKAAVTTECHRYRYYDFLRQSRFYEHIIRDEKDLNNIRDYITGNPLAWLKGEEYPNRMPIFMHKEET